MSIPQKRPRIDDADADDDDDSSSLFQQRVSDLKMSNINANSEINNNSNNTGLMLPIEAIQQYELPCAPFYSNSYPHSNIITHTAVSQLGYLVSAMDNGFINIFHLGFHEGFDNKNVKNFDFSQNSTKIVQNSQISTQNNPNEYHFRISLPLHKSPLISLMISACGNYCVSISLDGLVCVLNLTSFSVENTISLPFLPTCSTLLQQPPQTGPKTTGSIGMVCNDRHLSVCIGTITGHVYIYPLSTPSTTVLVSSVSQSPITSLSATPLSFFHQYLSKAQLNPSSEKTPKNYPCLSQASGYLLSTSDTAGNLELLLIPVEYTKVLPNLSLEPGMCTKNDIITTLQTVSLLSNPEVSSTPTPTPTTPQMIALQESTSSGNGRMTLYWGSLKSNVFFLAFGTIFSSILGHNITLKSQTDLFILRKSKFVGLSVQFSPNGQYFAVCSVPQQPQTDGGFLILIFSTLSMKILYTLNEQISSQYPSMNSPAIELNSDMLFKSKGVNVSPNSTTENANSLSMLLEQRLSHSTLNDTWSNVRLDDSSTVIKPRNSSTMGESQSLEPMFENNVFSKDSHEKYGKYGKYQKYEKNNSKCSFTNPNYIPSQYQTTRELQWGLFISSLYKSQINPLNETLKKLLHNAGKKTTNVNASDEHPSHSNSPLTTTSLTPINPQHSPLVVINSGDDTNDEHYRLFLSLYKPVIGTSHSTSFVQNDFFIFDKNSKYFFYSYFFGIKTIRLRDGFSIFPDIYPSIEQNSNDLDDLNAKKKHYHTLMRADTQEEVFDDEPPSQSESKKFFSAIGNGDVFLDPKIIHSQLILIDKDYFSQLNDSTITNVSLLLSNYTKTGLSGTQIDAQNDPNTVTLAPNSPHSPRTFELNKNLQQDIGIYSQHNYYNQSLNLQTQTNNNNNNNNNNAVSNYLPSPYLGNQLLSLPYQANKVLQYPSIQASPLLSKKLYNKSSRFPTHHESDLNDNIRTIDDQRTQQLKTALSKIKNDFANASHSTLHFYDLNPELFKSEEKLQFMKLREVITTLSFSNGLPTLNNANPSAGLSQSLLQTKLNQQNDKQMVTLHTNHGDMTFILYPSLTPKACENFITHSKTGYYNNLKFHRLIAGFMIQGGDPCGNGRGGESIWGVPFKDEFTPLLKHDGVGTLACANSGPNTNGSQFYITMGDCSHLDNKHTVFGKMIMVNRTQSDNNPAVGLNSINVLREIENLRVDSGDKPLQDVILLSITVHEDDM
jgi:cyclophilin family peptidyl-prolyl cis-trans isomerase